VIRIAAPTNVKERLVFSHALRDAGYEFVVNTPRPDRRQRTRPSPVNL